MPDNPRPPHDRGKELWDASEGPSRLLLSSMDRWTSALLADDGIDMPFMGGSDNVEAKISHLNTSHTKSEEKMAALEKQMRKVTKIVGIVKSGKI